MPLPSPKLFLWLAAVTLLTVACGTSDRSGASSRSREEAELAAAIENVASAEAALSTVLRRYPYVIKLPHSPLLLTARPAGEPLKPSDLYARMLQRPADPPARAFQALLDRSIARRPLSSGDASACIEQRWTDEPSAEPPFEPSAVRERAAKRLDAVTLMVLERCPPQGLAINSAAAVRPSDVNRFALKAEQERRAALAQDAPVSLPREDRRALLLGQGYFFDQTEDGRVPLGGFLIGTAQDAFIRVNRAFDEAGVKPGPTRMVFDRLKTSIGEQLGSQPKGWFNAIATADAIYVSPTLVRAALIACAAEIGIKPSYLAHLRSVHELVRTRRIATTDASGVLRGAESAFAKASACVAGQLTFLIGHEVAHRRLDTSSEQQADCAGAAVARHLQQRVPGVFRELIFDVAGSDDEEVLGASPASLRELTCRRVSPWILDVQPEPDLKKALSACRGLPVTCSAG